VIFIGRYSGASVLGQYTLAYNFYIIFSPFLLLGLNHFIVREIAKDKSNAGRYLVNIGFISFVVAVTCFISICFIVYLMNYPVDIRVTTYLIALALLPSVGILLCEVTFIAFEKVKYFLFAAIVEAVSKIFLGLSMLFLGYGINALMIVIVISKVLVLITSLYFFIRYIGKPHLEIDFGFCRKVIKEVALIFTLSGILYSILVRIDVVILSKFRNITEVGWYGLASNILWIGYILIFSLTTTIFPIISKLFVTSGDLFEAVCRKFLKYTLIIFLFMIIVTVFVSDKLILLFFGEGFMNSAVALKILIWSVLPAGWAIFCGRILIAGNNQKLDLYAVSAALGASLILTPLLSYRWGYIGTSAATLISMIILAISEHFFVHKYMLKLNIISIAGRPFIGAAVTGAFMLLFREQLSLSMLITSSLAIYFLSLFILRTFSKEDADLLRRLETFAQGF
jgi:O-antigen/teichoic acid export membrane protein